LIFCKPRETQEAGGVRVRSTKDLFTGKSRCLNRTNRCIAILASGNIPVPQKKLTTNCFSPSKTKIYIDLQFMSNGLADWHFLRSFSRRWEMGGSNKWKYSIHWPVNWHQSFVKYHVNVKGVSHKSNTKKLFPSNLTSFLTFLTLLLTFEKVNKDTTIFTFVYISLIFPLLLLSFKA